MKKLTLFVVLAGLTVVAFVGRPELWAAPAQTTDRQGGTVPTRTPTPGAATAEPTTPPTEPTDEPEP
ncbi:MAG: hypothetical protein ACODAJ_06895, partial [Planctomycetota bacterium]